MEKKPLEWKIGYKVVLKGKKIHYSATWLGCFAPTHLRERFKYCKERITKRRKGWGPMAVFISFMDAVDFQHLVTHPSIAIFKCWYLPSKTRSLYVSTRRSRTNIVPAGTDFADKVKLLKEVRERAK